MSSRHTHRRRRSDVASKSAAQIERETASKWADRAIDCFAKFEATGDAKWLVRGEDMKHEAVEHAATVGDYGKTAGRIQRMIERAVRSSVYATHAAASTRGRRRKRRRR